MLWTIIAIVAMFICLYVLGYCMAKLDRLRPMACIGPGCKKNGDGNPMHCPYWIEDKED